MRLIVVPGSWVGLSRSCPASRVPLFPDERTDMPRWLWIVIIIVLIVLVLGYFMRGRRGGV